LSHFGMQCKSCSWIVCRMWVGATTLVCYYILMNGTVEKLTIYDIYGDK
jgi:hypothetical protein